MEVILLIDYLSNTIADFYISRKIICRDEKEVYKSGIELILNDIVTFGLILFISVLMFNVRYAVEFLVVFCFTRIYCGGYHAPKAYLCRITMVIAFLFVAIGSSILKNLTDVFLCLLLLISFILMLPLIPVKHPNKKLTEQLIKKSFRYGVMLYIVFIVCSIIVFQYINKQDGIIIALSLCTVTVLAIIGFFNNERRCAHEKINR